MKHALSVTILGIRAAGRWGLAATLCLACSAWPADPVSADGAVRNSLTNLPLSHVLVRMAPIPGRESKSFISQSTIRQSKIKTKIFLRIKKQKQRHQGPSRPPVGRSQKHQKSSRKGSASQSSKPTNASGSSCIGIETRFRIILRLENAGRLGTKHAVSGRSLCDQPQKWTVPGAAWLNARSRIRRRCRRVDPATRSAA